MNQLPPDTARRVLAWDGNEWAVWHYFSEDMGPNRVPAEWSREMSEESHDKPQPTHWTELPSEPQP